MTAAARVKAGSQDRRVELLAALGGRGGQEQAAEEYKTTHRRVKVCITNDMTHTGALERIGGYLRSSSEQLAANSEQSARRLVGIASKVRNMIEVERAWSSQEYHNSQAITTLALRERGKTNNPANPQLSTHRRQLPRTKTRLS